MEYFADTSAFNAGVKEKNTKANKITIVKNQMKQRLYDHGYGAMITFVSFVFFFCGI
jgi:hypothetical protein